MSREKYCQNCKKILPEGVVYCPKCGSRVTSEGLQDSGTDAGTNTVPVSMGPKSVYLTSGTVLQDKYRINHLIGQGGFGITYDGTDLKLQMHIAIKEYFPGQIADRTITVSKDVTCTNSTVALYESGMKNFLTEARNMAKFAGQPNFVTVHDYFVENNTAYIIMEFVEGQNLSVYMKQHGTFSLESAMQIITPVMDSLEKIHNAGMIHRDISPSNIMVLSDGRIKLLDFGAVKDISWDTQTLTTMSAVFKKGYSPIEQQTLEMKQGTYSDIYALCATLYQMLTGIVPPSPFSRLAGNEMLIPPSSMGVRISASQEEGLLRGLEIYPQDRIQTVPELRHALNANAAYRGSQGVSRNASHSVPQSASYSAAGGQHGRNHSSRGGQSAPSDHKNVILLSILGCAALILCIAVAFLLTKGSDKKEQNSSPQLTDNVTTLAETDSDSEDGTDSADDSFNSSDAKGEANTDEITAAAESEGDSASETQSAAETQAGQTQSDTGSNTYASARNEAAEAAAAESEEAAAAEPVYDYPSDALAYGGHHYYIYNDIETTWEDAMDLCLERGGYLAVINDSIENEALFEYMNVQGYDQAFFGLHLVGDDWIYTEGDSSDFRDWGLNSKNEQQPNNGDENFTHTVLDTHMHDGHWSDTLFGEQTYTSDGHHYKNRYTYICEWDG